MKKIAFFLLALALLSGSTSLISKGPPKKNQKKQKNSGFFHLTVEEYLKNEKSFSSQ